MKAYSDFCVDMGTALIAWKSNSLAWPLSGSSKL